MHYLYKKYPTVFSNLIFNFIKSMDTTGGQSPSRFAYKAMYTADRLYARICLHLTLIIKIYKQLSIFDKAMPLNVSYN